MKYLFTPLCALIISLFSATAAVDTPKGLYQTIPVNGKAKKSIGRLNNANQASDASTHQWSDYGICDYTDDVITSFFSSVPVTYKVRVQKDDANPGFYRIIDPWTNHPDRQSILDQNGDDVKIGEGDDYYMLIDATNPKYVRLLNSPIGIDDGYGEASLCSRTELVGEPVDFYPLTQEEADLCAGILTDNVITFPKERSFAVIQDGSYYPANSDGAFRLNLNLTDEPTEHKWVDLGLCDYVDDIATSFFAVNPTGYKVRVQKDEANPGFYRILDPWTNYPFKEEIENDSHYDASFGTGDNYYILIDASDANYVRLLESPLGMDDGEGETTAFTLTELVGQIIGTGTETVSQENADKSAGKLIDNVITFPAIRGIALLQGDEFYAANGSGAFALALPGGKLPTDYSLNVQIKEYFCPDDNGDYHITLTGDYKIENIRYAIFETAPQTVPDNFAEISKPCALDETININVNDCKGRIIYAYFASLDADNEMQSDIVIPLDIPDADINQWEYFGKADLTEDLLACVFPTLFYVHTFEVDIERRTDNHKIYRIVNPYSGNWNNAEMYSVSHSHNHYIYINAEDDDNVYFEYSPIGVYISGQGECAISSDYYDMVNAYGLDFLNMFEIKSGGHIENNVLTFDRTGDIKILPKDYGKWVYANIYPNPDYNKDTDKGDYDDRIAGQFKLDFTKAFTGIEEISADNSNAPVEYFNLQGIKIEQPNGGVYIIRQGNKTYKKYIR